ncbi:MAG TPA: PQQ-binding-like beta-propeller repeat protein [Steroidobacteraceae bacterium]|nr:PQQ-binding-like beta-propeller repeat protein [Steroidobacteraceae bacterium]
MRQVFTGLAGLAMAAAAQAAQNGWPTYNGDYGASRFSPLKQLNRGNAADLRVLCEITLGDQGIFQAGPVVIGDTLYVTTIHTLVALDASSCKLRWRHAFEPEGDEPLPANRGAAFLDGRVFRGTGDGWVIALEAASGRELWKVRAADPAAGEFLSMAPIAWNGLVFIGPAGSEWGIRGRILALDAATGREVWRFNTIPHKGEAGYESWHVPDTTQHGGGGTWSSFTLDARTGELFVPVGNPAPDFTPGYRPGDNLYTNSMVVLDARSGKLQWYYQLVRNDAFDYDLAAAPALFTDRIGHRRVAVAGKDGYLYVIDRDTHHLVSKTPVTTVKAPASLPTAQGVFACPGADGGVQWNGPAYSPLTNALYVGSVDWCMTVRSGPVKYQAPLVFMGTFPDFSSNTGPRSGWLYSVDAGNGAVRWRYHADSPVLSGATPTAGGVVLSGDSAGNLLVFDAADGTLLKKQPLGGSMGGGVITYLAGNRQYVATTAGNVSRSGLSTGDDYIPKLVILTTGLPADHVAVRELAVPEAELRHRFGKDPGKSIFNIFCSSCHGQGGVGGEGGPQLTKPATTRSRTQMIEWIKHPAPPMPSMSPPLSNSEVEEVADYVLGLK